MEQLHKLEDVEWIDIKALKLNPKNPNKHPKEQIERLAKILKYQGFRQPIVVSNQSGFVVAGHGRLAAARKNKWDKVPVVRQDFTDATQEYAHMTADNAIASWAELSMEEINMETMELGPFDTELLGIKNWETIPEDKYADKDGDAIPETAKNEYGVELGDVYTLGSHRLMCGDSTDRQCVEKLMSGEKPILMVTDPPYGVNLDQTWREEALGDKLLAKTNSNRVSNDDRADWFEVWEICQAEVAYVWHASAFADVVMDSLRRADFEIRQQIIWNKSIMIMGRGAYHWKHEPCWYAVRKGKNASWIGDRKQVTVWDAAPPAHIMGGSKDDKTEHPTQKPLVVYKIPIENHLPKGEWMYDPFGGSGSCIIAAEKTGRRCMAMELDPHYCSVILKRWEQFTGLKAVKEEPK